MISTLAGYSSRCQFAWRTSLILVAVLSLISLNSDASSSRDFKKVLSQTLEKGVFLIASREMTDPRFRETVILVTEHEREGTLGIIINRPTDIDMADIFPDMDALKEHVMHPYIGGPIHPTFLSVLVNNPQSRKDMLPVIDDVFFGLGNGLAADLIADAKKDDRLHVYFGYAGWTAGQLEYELHRGDWYMIKADDEAIFDKDPAKLWNKYIKLVTGIWL